MRRTKNRSRLDQWKSLLTVRSEAILEACIRSGLIMGSNQLDQDALRNLKETSIQYHLNPHMQLK